jgi:A/G-specific adenine glycosylase
MVDALAAWFEEHQRSLPWRAEYDPYHVWLSEVMLQQTQVETVLPYYEQFLREFPTVHALASAPEERVLKVWAGLGYYRRAKNLHAAAREIVHKHRGRVPDEYEPLIALPGVGRYIAGAVLSIAFNKRYPVVDGNVRRVLSRIHAWVNDDPETQWKAAASLVQEGEPRIVNQALMELGATVCSFRNPRCLLCPVQSSCLAFRSGMQEAIPPVKKRAATIQVHLCAIVLRKGDRYLMRSAEGLWEFPMMPKLPEGRFERVGTCRHVITHHRLNVTVYQGKAKTMEGCTWKKFDAVPTSSLTRKVAVIAGGRPDVSRRHSVSVARTGMAGSSESDKAKHQESGERGLGKAPSQGT